MSGGAFGWVVLATLTSLAAVDALGLALRARPTGRAELAVVATAIWFALVAGPVLVLGYADVLAPTVLAPTSAVVLGGIFVLLARPAGPGALLRQCASAARAVASIPRAALVEAARARSFVLVGLLFASGILVAALFFTVFAPNENWDGFLYHEPIVGFAIQNHGFAVVPLQAHQAVQAANGYPRLCEAVMYWLVAFTDKTLIELPNLLGAPAMMLAIYAIARRYGDRLTAMGWACVLFLVPQCWSQMCQTLIDADVAFFALVAIHFATRPQLRLGDALCAMLGMALVLGSKGSGIVMVPPVLLVVVARLVVRRSGHPPGRRIAWPALAIAAAGSLFLAALGVYVPLRNLAAFHDPFWPVTFEAPRFGVHWSGLITLAELGSQKPFVELVAQAYGIPMGGMEDVIFHGYGYAAVWVVFPLGLLAAAVALVAAGLERVGWREKSDASNLGLVLLLVVAGLATTPTLNGQSARYNLHLVGGLMVGVVWLLSARPWSRLREGVLAAALALSIVPLFWMRGRGWYWVSTNFPEDVVLHPLASRTELVRPSFDLLARQRNEELARGDVAAFDQDVTFIGALWNFEFSNGVRYVKYESSREFLSALDRIAAKWSAVAKEGGARQALEQSGRWELVGSIYPDGDVVFRRRGR